MQLVDRRSNEANNGNSSIGSHGQSLYANRRIVCIGDVSKSPTPSYKIVQEDVLSNYFPECVICITIYSLTCRILLAVSWNRIRLYHIN